MHFSVHCVLCNALNKVRKNNNDAMIQHFIESERVRVSGDETGSGSE